MPPFDLTGQTTRAVPRSNYLDDLGQFFGAGEGEDTLNPTMSEANAPVLAAALHSARTKEAAQQAAVDPRYRQRAEGLIAEDAQDPYSDISSMAREKKQQSDLDALNEFMSPQEQAKRAMVRGEQGQAAEQEAYGKAHGGFQAQISDAGQQAADQAFQGKAALEGIKAGAKTQKLSQQEQQLVDSSNGIASLGKELMSKFEAKYPGIAQDPHKYGSVTDMLTQKFGKGWYSLGGMTDDDELLQDAGAIQAWGMRSLIAGRINKQMMDIINAHLPQPGLSSGANYDRLRRLTTQILPAQLTGIGAGHQFDVNNPLGNYLGR